MPSLQRLTKYPNPHPKIPGNVLVASIFPMERLLNKWSFTPVNRFHLPAVKQGDAPALLEIGNQSENVYMGGATFKDPRGNIVPRIHMALAIAQDLARDDFAIGKGKGGAPGVWVVGHLDTDAAREIRRLHEESLPLERGEITNPERLASIYQEIDNFERVRFQAEVEYAHRLQDLFFEEWIDHAERLVSRGRQGDIIDMHKVAAAWHGLQNRSWLMALSDTQTKECPYCHFHVITTAVICTKCLQVLDAVRYAEMKAEEELAIQQARERVFARAKAAQQASTEESDSPATDSAWDVSKGQPATTGKK